MSCNIERMADTVTYSSPESMSVRPERGERAMWMAVRIWRSCQVGSKWLAFLSALRTVQMAFSCSIMQATIFTIEPHLLGLSATSVCSSSWRFSCALPRSLVHFQLIEDALTIFQHCAKDRLHHWSALIYLVIAKCKLCSKQEWRDHWRRSAAFIKLAALSVVGQSWCWALKSHAASMDSIAPARFSPVWPSGRKWVWRHLFSIFHPSVT